MNVDTIHNYQWNTMLQVKPEFIQFQFSKECLEWDMNVKALQQSVMHYYYSYYGNA